jgi:hypothetical protein
MFEFEQIIIVLDAPLAWDPVDKVPQQKSNFALLLWMLLRDTVTNDNNVCALNRKGHV